jgi:hypothetical protein
MLLEAFGSKCGIICRHHSSFECFMRTIIELPEPSLMQLDAWAKEQNISRAEAVRRAVDQMLKRLAQPKGIGFGLWNPSGAPLPQERGGLALQRELRDEWPD